MLKATVAVVAATVLAVPVYATPVTRTVNFNYHFEPGFVRQEADVGPWLNLPYFNDRTVRSINAEINASIRSTNCIGYWGMGRGANSTNGYMFAESAFEGTGDPTSYSSFEHQSAATVYRYNEPNSVCDTQPLNYVHSSYLPLVGSEDFQAIIIDDFVFGRFYYDAINDFEGVDYFGYNYTDIVGTLTVTYDVVDPPVTLLVGLASFGILGRAGVVARVKLLRRKG